MSVITLTIVRKMNLKDMHSLQDDLQKVVQRQRQSLLPLSSEIQAKAAVFCWICYKGKCCTWSGKEKEKQREKKLHIGIM